MTEHSKISRALAICMAVMMFSGLGTLLIPSGTMLVSAGPIPSVKSGDWVVTGIERYDGGSCVLSGNLTIKNGGNLVLNNLILAIDNLHDGNRSIALLAGGVLRIFNSTIKSNTGFRSHYLDSQGLLQVENSTLRDFGANASWTGISLNGGAATLKNDSILYSNIGFTIYAGTPVVKNVRIDHIYQGGIWVEGGIQSFYNVTITNCTACTGMMGGYINWGMGTATFYNSSITGNVGNGIYLEDDTSEFYNTTITGNTVDLNLVDYGLATEAHMFNSKYSTKTFGTHQAGAIKIIVYWFAGIFAKWQSDNASVSAGTSTVHDQGGSLIMTKSFDGTGRPLYLPVKDYQVTSLANTSYGPYKFDVVGIRGVTRNGTVVSAVKKNIDLKFVFDDLAPNITILSPADGFLTNKTSVQLTGSTEPGAKVWVQDQPITVNGDGTFATNVGLTIEGKNLIKVKAQDLLANECIAQINVTRDTKPPKLTIVSPTDGALFNHTLIPVQGATDAGAKLKVNGHDVTVGLDGKYYTNLTLPEGKDLIIVTSADEIGNSFTLRENITIDLTPPILTITAPLEGFRTNVSTVTVTGITEVSANVTVDGTNVALNGLNIQTIVTLTDGRNSIIIRSCDLAYNCAVRTVTGTMDSIPPVLAVSSPPSSDEVLTNKGQFQLNGTTEPGANLSINGKAVNAAANGSFSVSLDLKEGSNLFVVTSSDPFNNIVSVSRKVLRDSIPPALEVQAPVDGLRTRDTQVKVSGTTELGALLTVNGALVSFTGTSFSKTVPLQAEGANNITITAKDKAGNLKTIALTVVKDTNVALTIVQPVTGIHTKNESVTVSGITDPKAKVQINDLALIAGSDGKFSTVVNLTVGDNVFHVNVTDDVGNTASGSVTVIRDKKVTPVPGTGFGGNGLLLPLVLIIVVLAGVGTAAAMMMRRKKAQPVPPPSQPSAVPPPQPPAQPPGNYDPNAQYYNQYGGQQYPPQTPPNNPGY